MNKALLVTISFTGFILDLVACYPGFLYIDSVDQYTQSIHFSYTDWHPPIMAGVWSLLNFIYKGPLLMLVMQLALLWTSFYLIASTWCRKSLPLIALLLLFALAPYVQNFAGLIVKDTQMAFCWLLAVTIILRANYQARTMSKTEVVITFLLITYGTMVRINALPGSIPLYYLWVENIYTGTFSKKIAWLMLALTGLLIINSTITKYVLKPRKTYPEYKLMAHDIAGIYVTTGKSYFPAFVTSYPAFDTNLIRQRFTTATLDNLWWINGATTMFAPLDEASRKVLINHWEKAILENKATYLRNRFDGFLYYLQLKQRPDTTFYYFYPYIHTNPYGFKLKETPVFRAYTTYIKANKDLPFMKPWFWLLLPVVQLLLTLKLPAGRFRTATQCLALSSLLYLLPQFFIYQADTEFRYFYWCCVSTSLHTVLLISWYIHKKTAASHPSTNGNKKALRRSEGPTII
ncbi:hypothetical protein [Paraflavitalea sp. CAU 1676]|uniref:hypothetical protein n=1 Tax=Paraflavitalea sp. CAU 1676 TaxID=3032598 RepID=UPI0023DAC586|nr:hypothetical protein [Paraflavitalea sp. CAU 1676]MDF2187446.1 hypothetical protein [Paraflavitalea sp. CAU 1676]